MTVLHIAAYMLLATIPAVLALGICLLWRDRQRRRRIRAHDQQHREQTVAGCPWCLQPAATIQPAGPVS